MSEIKFNTSKLRGRIFEKYKTLNDFARDLKLNRATTCNKVNGETQWKAAEIYRAAQLLSISQQELGTYFFTPEVGKSQSGGAA